jgi:hypothetical protein
MKDMVPMWIASMDQESGFEEAGDEAGCSIEARGGVGHGRITGWLTLSP